MATAHDVAKYILEHKGAMSTMKLQKLTYYSLAWSLVWDEEPLFGERVEAWAGGPVVPILYNTHRGEYSVSSWPLGDTGNIAHYHKETIGVIIKSYGDFNPQQLSDMTHSERPWKDARAGIPDGQPCSNPITHEAMAEYYSSLH